MSFPWLRGYKPDFLKKTEKKEKAEIKIKSSDDKEVNFELVDQESDAEKPKEELENKGGVSRARRQI